MSFVDGVMSQIDMVETERKEPMARRKEKTTTKFAYKLVDSHLPFKKI